MNKTDRLLGSIVIRILNSTNLERTMNKSTKRINNALRRKKENYASVILDDDAEEVRSLLYDVVKDIMGKDAIDNNNYITKCLSIYNDKCSPKLLLDNKGKIRNKAFHF